MFTWRGVNLSIKSEEVYRKGNFLLYLQKNKNKKQKLKIKGAESDFTLINSETPEKLLLIAVGFYIFYHFCSDPDQIFKNKNQCKKFDIVAVTSNQIKYISSGA